MEIFIGAGDKELALWCGDSGDSYLNEFFEKIFKLAEEVDREFKVVLLWRLAKFMGKANAEFTGIDSAVYSKLVKKLSGSLAKEEFYLFTEFEKLILYQILLFSKKNLQKDAKPAFKTLNEFTQKNLQQSGMHKPIQNYYEQVLEFDSITKNNVKSCTNKIFN